MAEEEEEEEEGRKVVVASAAAPKSVSVPQAVIRKRRHPPPWVRPAGTRFVVDGFTYACEGMGIEHWFLTHFHADRYEGLSAEFARGVVYGSETTMRLVREKLGVEASRTRALPVGVPTRVDGVDVTFIDANHCPGAVMIMFENITSATSGAALPPVLHTGDFRFHADMRQNAHLLAVSNKQPILILDTTYCSLEHDSFPTQEHVLRAACDAVRSEDCGASTRKLFLFGSYTIGKEKVFLSVARALRRPVYVGKAKRAVLDALDLPREDLKLISTRDDKTNLHVVPMGSTSFRKMAAIMKYYRSRFDSVIAFRPTGWTFSAERKTSRKTTRRQHGKLVQYGLPYSEHSSLREMREFVRFISPRKIFPHVGNDFGERLARMLRLLTASDDEYACMLAEYDDLHRRRQVAN